MDGGEGGEGGGEEKSWREIKTRMRCARSHADAESGKAYVGGRCLQSVQIVPVYFLHACAILDTIRRCHNLLHISAAQRHPVMRVLDPRPGGVREAIK